MKQPEAKGRRVVSRGVSSVSSVDHGDSASPGPAALPVLDTSHWPADSSRWLSLTASALYDAGVDDDEAMLMLDRASRGARTVVDIMDGCLVALRRFYQVEA